MLTQERLKEVLHYNPLTGNFTWRVKVAQRVKVGDIAGTVNNYGYIRITIDGKLYMAHRLVWLYLYGYFPSKQIDHINHDRADNRLINLRCVTNAENLKNQSKFSNNTSGVTGVCWHKLKQKWVVRININDKRLNLGYTPDFDIAVAMRKASERKYGYHENHGVSL